MNVTQRVVHALTSPPLSPLFRPFVRGAVPIFMLHRFADRELGSGGTDPLVLRAQLEYLRREKVDLLSLTDLAGERSAESASRPAAVFTVDDGYTDFATVAAPIFAEFDCPVTVFIVTGVADAGTWFWWDRVHFAFEWTSQFSMEIEIANTTRRFDWADRTRADAAAKLVALVKTIPDAERIAVLERLPIALDVEVPCKPPPHFRAMSWEDIRRFDAGGLVTFGPHTVTHPALPRTTDAHAVREIEDSWTRLREEAHAVMPVFCYPSGAYSEREVAILEQTDLLGALTSEHRYASRRAFASMPPRRRFAVPRVGCHDEMQHFLQIATGVERVKLGVRQGRRGWSTAGADASGSDGGNE